MKSEVFLMDCMEGMKQYPDKYFDLALVDPPYGIGEKFAGGKTGKMNFNEIVKKDWDNLPNADYFTELARVSRNQIIWGGNYFLDFLGATRCLLFWDKKIAFDFSLAQFEVAWTSFDKLCKKIELKSQETKIHPTQKPVALYDWIYKNYLPDGGKVLDTHLGSGSNRIAAHKAGNIDFTAFEIDKDYFEAQEKRFAIYKSQLTIF